MNKLPLHKASQYSDSGVVLHRIDSHGISHAPVCYAHQDDYYVLGLLTFRKLLTEHLSKNRQPSYYASLLNISTVYLNEVVKKVTGMSTALYIKGEVVLQAKRLLCNTTLSVKQIADRLVRMEYSLSPMPTSRYQVFGKE